ncbi:MAG: ABC transporter ATP-binding protein [Clostridia bacterium]|nr:ABC transporter ATP-binding protein [Clostridia bacterium]
MREYYPLLIAGAVIGTFAAAFILAYALMKDKKEAIGFDRNMKDGEITKRLLKYAKPYYKSFLLVFFIMLVSIAYDIASPLIIGSITDVLKTNFEMRELFTRIGIYVSILIVSLTCQYFQAIILQRTGQRIISSLRYDTFEHIEKLSHQQFSEIPVGKLVTRVTNDTNAVSMMFTNIFVNLAKNSLVIIGILIAMFILNLELTLMVLCFVPFIVIFTLIFRKFSRKAYRRVKDGTTDINTFLSENLSGMKIIRVFDRKKQKMKEFDAKNDELGAAKRRQIFVFGIFRPTIYMLYISSVLALLYLSGRGYINGTSFMGQVITSATLVEFYMYIQKFFNPIQSLAEQFNWLQSAFASAEKIFTVLDIKPEVVDRPGAVDIGEVKGEIEFDHVWFAYKDENWILKDLSFKVEAKQTVALVGPTGAGKTTILSLLCRNYDIQKGRILIDGVDIRNYTISSLRRQFGQMLQTVFLFSGTIKSNIVLREEGITDEEIWDACKYVNADKFISRLSDGLDHEVREFGNNFSAGQRQLISFARTVLYKPKIMILDEATANIDTETEQLIQDSLEKMMNIGTMLVVAHRLSTIQHADNIIVLQGGQIAEQGTHDQLLAARGKYYNLYTLQHRRQQLMQ